MKWLAILLVLAGCHSLDQDTERGRSLYEEGQFEEAVRAFENVRVAAERTTYNAATARYRAALETPDDIARAKGMDAVVQTLDSLTVREDVELGFAAKFNLGNAQFQLGRYREAMAAYRGALDLVPGHDGARYNYQVALRRLRARDAAGASGPENGVGAGRASPSGSQDTGAQTGAQTQGQRRGAGSGRVGRRGTVRESERKLEALEQRSVQAFREAVRDNKKIPRGTTSLDARW